MRHSSVVARWFFVLLVLFVAVSCGRNEAVKPKVVEPAAKAPATSAVQSKPVSQKTSANKKTSKQNTNYNGVTVFDESQSR